MSATTKTIRLFGDPNTPESAEHNIIFPGGSISVCRTSDDQYWAHICVNAGPVLPGTITHEKTGRLIKIRDEKQDDNFAHFAVLIGTE